jgi:hypothetical protein
MKVFLSSTSIDLKFHRVATTDALERLGSQVDRMEVFGARADDPTQASLKDLEKSELFVGIFAHRYGCIPSGSTTSITEQEYDHAMKLKKPMFCFLVDENHLWVPSMIDNDEPAKSKLRAFKDRIRADSTIGVFTTPDDLASKVVTSVSRYLTQPTIVSTETQEQIDQTRNAMSPAESGFFKQHLKCSCEENGGKKIRSF